MVKRKTLLIDNEEVFLFINSKVISLTGFESEIQTASSGSEALEIINKYLTGREAIPDFIFIDLDMPVMDGFQFIRAFQSMEFPNKKNTTLIILTSSISQADRDRAKDLGINHFITKPLQVEDVKRLFLGDDWNKPS